MSVLVHHTDAEREYAYDQHTEKVMPLATKEGWTVVDIKNDWKTVLVESNRYDIRGTSPSSPAIGKQASPAYPPG